MVPFTHDAPEPLDNRRMVALLSNCFNHYLLRHVSSLEICREPRLKGSSPEKVHDLLARSYAYVMDIDHTRRPVIQFTVWKHSMLIDAATFIGAFAAGYGFRAWISARRRRAVRKARGD
jgi:hypothetical protein